MKRLSVFRNKGIEVNHRLDPVGDAREPASGHHAPIALTDESHVLKILHFNVSNDVFDMCRKSGGPVSQMTALAKPG